MRDNSRQRKLKSSDFHQRADPAQRRRVFGLQKNHQHHGDADDLNILEILGVQSVIEPGNRVSGTKPTVNAISKTAINCLLPIVSATVHKIGDFALVSTIWMKDIHPLHEASE